MATALRFGPADHGRAMTFDEFIAGEYESGHRYEIIDGRLYVSPAPNYSHDWLQRHVQRLLANYAERCPAVINCVTGGARVFVPGSRTTAPEPDLAAYRDVPPGPQLHWRSISPLIVVEILGDEDGASKDLERNVAFYWQIPSIEEYWLFDIREDPAQPKLRVHRRQRDAWDVADFDADAVYRTDLLPGFEMPIAPGRT